MKLQISRSTDNAGSVLVVTLFTTFLIGVTLASFLMLAQHQVFANARSQTWNSGMAIAESGVEDAMQLLNKYSYDNEKLLEWATTASITEDHWQVYGPDSFYTVRVAGTNDVRSAYVVIITNSNPNAPTITSYGFARYDHEYRHDPVTTATVGAQFDGFQTRFLDRHVHVTARRYARWALAMLADREIDLNGNVVTTDSFDSSDPSKSDWSWDALASYGIYDASVSGDQGDIATNLRLIDSLNSGNAQITGHASTGPGGTIAIGPNGSIGSESWVSSGTTGIEPGYSNDDMNVALEEVGLPTTTWFYLPVFSGLGTNINGVNYKHVILADGDYKSSTLSGSVYVGPGVEARILLTDSVRLTANEEIRIDSDAMGLTVYMAGSRFTLGGNGVVNETGLAQKFQYFGLPTNTELNFLGNADFVGAIYAPQADFTLGGGGSSVYDFIGASVTRSVTMNGSYHFHYDEDLANVGPARGFIPTTWAEVPRGFTGL